MQPFERITSDTISEIYHTPLLNLIFRAASVHREQNNYAEVQISSLISVKTGGCVEDCAYCPQAARYNTGVDVHALMPLDKVVAMATTAKNNGASRVCMGASWREVRDNKDFDKVLEMVEAVNDLGLEVCCTLGMVNAMQAKRLKDAGCYAYNHNIDTSEDYYKEIISTRNFNDRLETLDNVRQANMTVCSGGIIGMGESHKDRIGMLHTLANLPVQPDSVPINALVAVKGTPLEQQEKVPIEDVVRMVATARIIMPQSVVRLSAGRNEMSFADQALCFMAGANSIFAGEKLLTTANPDIDIDMKMFSILGLTPREAFKKEKAENKEAYAG